MNKVLLTGRLTRDPEMRSLASGKSVTTFTVASNEFIGGGREKSEYTAVVTWVLCTIPDPSGALAEVRRVLRPGGRLLFVEHTRSAQAGLARWQARLNPLWGWLAGGCHLDRPGVELVRASGLRVEQVEPFGRERWTLFPLYRGVAVCPT